MKTSILVGCVLAALSLAVGAEAAPSRPVVTINSQTSGPTPFINKLDISISPASPIKAIKYSIAPKPFSVTRAVSTSYSGTYLKGRGFLDTAGSHVTLPVFGLYQNRENIVTLTFDFASGPSQQQVVSITTPPWADPTGGAYLNPTVSQARTNSTDLSYDFIMLKGFAAAITPIIVDTDAEVRWVGTSGIAAISSIFYDNGIIISNGTGISRMEFDGATNFVADYSGIGVTSTNHHNFDRGKDGILVEVDETDSIESTVIEVAATGAVLRTWKLAPILRATMVAGGDDPSAFVRAPDDWFHMNAATYDPHNNTIILSGREDFVIALDYDTGAVRWILGDPTKAWYGYPSLRKFSLTLLGDTQPPIGHHAVSITRDRELLLFDDGAASFAHSPPGENRGYSVCRKYHINERKLTAQETWTYEPSPALNSPFCSSIYEDAKDNYLMDFTLTGDVIGLDASGAQVFRYIYSTANFCAISWNAAPVHLESVEYE